MLDKIEEFLAEPLAQKLLFFNEMLTPKVIRLAYWLCLLVILWTGLGHMFSGGFSSFLEGIAYIATGAILARMAAELVILLFKLNENIEKVVDNTKSTATKRTVRKKAVKKTTNKTGDSAE